MWLLIYGREKAELMVASKTASIVIRQCQNIVNFQRKGSGIALKLLRHF